jgi:hypothetical protein
MKEMPKQAGELLEKGEVERWFMINGWRYPVQGPSAQGVAAVQQFFEGMGLSKPPPLSVEPSLLELSCKAGGAAHGEIQLKTTAKKWVYAFLESGESWIKPVQPNAAGGQSALIAFQTTSRGLTPASRHQGTLTLVANGGQRLQVRVGLTVAEEATVMQRFLQPFLTGLLSGLLLRAICILPDLAARNWQADRPSDYVQKFSVYSFWLVILIFWFMLRHNGKFRDFVAALFAGALIGLVAFGTLAQVIPLVDQFIPWGTWPGANVLSWGIVGGFLGLVVALLNGRARRFIQTLGEKLAKVAYGLRLRPLANLLEI